LKKRYGNRFVGLAPNGEGKIHLWAYRDEDRSELDPEHLETHCGIRWPFESKPILTTKGPICKRCEKEINRIEKIIRERKKWEKII
jgi:hypothetical protein